VVKRFVRVDLDDRTCQAGPTKRLNGSQPTWEAVQALGDAAGGDALTTASASPAANANRPGDPGAASFSCRVHGGWPYPRQDRVRVLDGERAAGCQRGSGRNPLVGRGLSGVSWRSRLAC
jgi:hypothetical protein